MANSFEESVRRLLKPTAKLSPPFQVLGMPEFQNMLPVSTEAALVVSWLFDNCTWLLLVYAVVKVGRSGVERAIAKSYVCGFKRST